MTSIYVFIFLFFVASFTTGDASADAHHKKTHHGKKAGGRGLRNGGSTPTSQLRRDMREAVDEVLGSGHGISQQGLESIRREIEPMWRAMPRNQQDRIDRVSLQYVVQRMFLRRHGLSIVGLEPHHANSTRSEAALLTSFAPNYVRKVLEGEHSQKGFYMEDAVGMIAALERLVQHSGNAVLEDAYKSLKLDTGRDIGRKAIGEVMEGFMLRWMLGDDQESIQMLEANASLKEASFEDWPHIAHFVQGQITAFEYARLHPIGNGAPASKWNAFKPHFSFEDAESLVGGVAMSFGSYWETECANTKESLMKMDTTGSGRVKLADFHGAALNGEWRFSESKEYLRQLGALDETSTWYGPRVLITNYVQAPSNCIVTSEHYRVCCSNECEHYMSELENAIQNPTATPDEILPIIERLSSGFDDNDSKLTFKLRSQLREIGRSHGGKIPLHGRLFAQWLHYVFPLECPFPHKSGTTTTLTPLAFGDDYMASEDEMANHAQAENSGSTSESKSYEDEWMQNWSHEEELLVTELRTPWEVDFSTSVLGMFVVAGICLALVKSGVISSGGGKDVLPTRMSSGLKSHYV